MVKYSLATTSWNEAEISAIHDVVNSQKFSMGGKVAELEREFANYLGSKYCVMTSSGSTANLISIASLFYTRNGALNRGDEVIVPAVSWSTTYFPLQQYGLRLKFVDVDLNTMNYKLDELKDAISSTTKLIVCVNLLGNPNDFDVIAELVEGKDIKIFEDNCESLGASYKGKCAGTFGVMGTFSFFFSHHISTMEGGMISTNDVELYHILLSLRAHGWTRDLPMINQVSNKSSNAFEESYRFILPGYNVRPLEMSGAIGLEQLKKLDSFVEMRRMNAEYFLKRIRKFEWLSTQEEIAASSWFGFALVVKESSPVSRDELVKYLGDHFIETRPIVTGNFTKNEVMKFFDYEISGRLINANIIDSNGFFIGNSHENLFKEIDWFITVLSKL